VTILEAYRIQVAYCLEIYRFDPDRAARVNAVLRLLEGRHGRWRVFRHRSRIVHVLESAWAEEYRIATGEE